MQLLMQSERDCNIYGSVCSESRGRSVNGTDADFFHPCWVKVLCQWEWILIIFYYQPTDLWNQATHFLVRYKQSLALHSSIDIKFPTSLHWSKVILVRSIHNTEEHWNLLNYTIFELWPFSHGSVDVLILTNWGIKYFDKLMRGNAFICIKIPFHWTLLHHLP